MSRFPTAVPDTRRPRSGPHDRLARWYEVERGRRRFEAKGDLATAVQEAGGGRSEYEYDLRGDVVLIREPNGAETRYSYDADRRLTEVRHPDGSTSVYEYDGQGRLAAADERGVGCRFAHDSRGRLVRLQRGDAPAAIYRYDAEGRVCEARAGAVTSSTAYDSHGRIRALDQTFDGVRLEARFEYDEAGLLSSLHLPGQSLPLNYRWDGRGRPLEVRRGEERLASFRYDDAARVSEVHFANGVVETSRSDPVDGRTMEVEAAREGKVLLRRRFTYSPSLQATGDGTSAYRYDALGRLTEVQKDGAVLLRYAHDAADNRSRSEGPEGRREYRHDLLGRLLEITTGDGVLIETRTYDRLGRLALRSSAGAEWTYRYDDADRLLEVRRNGTTRAEYVYDHKGRLVLSRTADDVERYFYGADDELLGVWDATGNLLWAAVRTPWGPLAEIVGGAVVFLHHDGQGTCLRRTDSEGKEVASFRLGPFGEILEATPGFRPIFKGRLWHADAGLFSFGARWYEPETGRFLTRDTYTGAPDDERLLHPAQPAGRQGVQRDAILGDWLKRPRVRHPYAFCGNDPVNVVDPSGHWSFGGVVLSLLGAIWTLPNTIFGLAIEITCLVGEVIRWIVWLVTAGNVSWATPGFDAKASGRLNAFALVFRGGWMGSFSRLMGITFGNVMFVNKDSDTHPQTSGGGPVSPTAYAGSVTLADKNEAFYEHELRHTNQYGWFGPFFHLGLPIWGVYIWDMMINGYRNGFFETDAREHGGI